MQSTDEIVSSRLRILREQDNRTKASMARKIGVSPRAYYYYESGQAHIRLSLLVKIADGFSVTTDYLLGLSDDPHGYRFPEVVSYFPLTGTLIASRH